MSDSDVEVGIIDKKRYYEEDWSKITIADTIDYDRNYIEKRKEEGFDTSSLKHFFIGGCYSAESIHTMIEFMQDINPGQQMTLAVADINSEAFTAIKKRYLRCS